MLRYDLLLPFGTALKMPLGAAETESQTCGLAWCADKGLESDSMSPWPNGPLHMDQREHPSAPSAHPGAIAPSHRRYRFGHRSAAATIFPQPGGITSWTGSPPLPRKSGICWHCRRSSACPFCWGLLVVRSSGPGADRPPRESSRTTFALWHGSRGIRDAERSRGFDPKLGCP